MMNNKRGKGLGKNAGSESSSNREPKIFLRQGENLPNKSQYLAKNKVLTGSRLENGTLHFIEGIPNDTQSAWTFTIQPTKDFLAFHESYTFCIKVCVLHLMLI